MVVFWLEGAPNGPPQGSQRSKRYKLVFHEKLRYKIALWGKSTMGNWALVPRKAVKEISDLGHALVIFLLKEPPRSPPGSPTVPNG